jgi:SAM-dependent methyltransferase
MTTLANWLVRRTLSADRSRLHIAVLRRVPGLRRLLRDRSLDGWRRRHPFDELHGTDTAGYVAARDLRSGAASDPYITGYAGCAPGIVRRMLDYVPDPAATTILDLGCGKGRALIVATEFGFRRVVGVELSPDLCRAASANAEIVAGRFPGRAKIEVVQGDAVAFDLPEGPLAIFLYHPFHRILMQRLADRLAADRAERTIHVLYCNAVFADIFDRAPGFTPVFAGTMACDPGERGYAAADEEPVAIWRR